MGFYPDVMSEEAQYDIAGRKRDSKKVGSKSSKIDKQFQLSLVIG